ncbi:MAG: 23S rRNA (adenine(2503)-C(2))-methyltransferase RlmN [Bacteroidia bacterium]|jgi:23S rRNA (adenine2503-C2)-methyltransferase|nr:23S rRNA (adenine(2503)-C(2))-methyltransferase RlmN [Bacteroidia bacterium]
MSAKKDIRSYSLIHLQDWFTEMGEKTFRAKQVYEWLWKKSAHDFDVMSNLPIALRDKLKSSFTINGITVVDKQISKDGTIKSSFRLHDGHLIEGVLIPADDRMTACVSSQVGCSLTCKFCATGKMDRIRNLNPDEIYDQVVHIRNWANQHYGKPLTNIVFMGMGEPLLNYGNVLNGIAKITGEEGLHMASDRITVSTAGIAKMIKKLADDEVKFNLALSLHAANDVKRNAIMPINESNALETVIDALIYFKAKAKGKLTFEYIAFKDFNDGIEDARELLAICKKVSAKVNIIEYNPIGDGLFKKANADKIDQFQRYLEKNGVTATVRRSRGKDIDAACGQLANKKHEDALMVESK